MDPIDSAKILWMTSGLMVIGAGVFAFQPELTVTQLYYFIMVLVVLLGAFDGPLTVYLPRLFSTNIRYSATAVGYNIGGAAIGGLAPFILSLLLHFFPYPQCVLGVYLMLFALCACVSVSWGDGALIPFTTTQKVT